MLLNLNSEQWEMIKDTLDVPGKNFLLRALFTGQLPDNYPEVKIAYNFITAKKTKNPPKDTFKQPNVTLDPKTGLLTGITDELFEYYVKLYPHTNIEQELLAIAGWATSNNIRRNPWNRTITNWLANTEKNGGVNSYSKKSNGGTNNANL